MNLDFYINNNNNNMSKGSENNNSDFEYNEYDEKATKLSRKAYNNKKEDISVAVKVLKGCLELVAFTGKMTGLGVRFLFGAMKASTKIINKKKEEDNG